VTRVAPSGLQDSVRARLARLAARTGDDFQDVLVRYGLERLLYRLSRSEWRDRFLLKGALLFAAWSRRPHRPTRDADLLGFGNVSIPELERVFRALGELAVEPDGLEFLSDAVRGQPIAVDDEYSGVRLTLRVRLGQAAFPLQVDVGVGDSVVPAAEEVELPTLLAFPAPRLRGYSRYTVVAEKCQIIVARGRLNSRMKDYYDLSLMAGQFSFEGRGLCEALGATFRRRETARPAGVPEGLGDGFAVAPDKRAQWQAFAERVGGQERMPELADVVRRLRSFLSEPTSATADGQVLEATWLPDRLEWREEKADA
jgi:hypothetical protein